jgi:hypothetical protein
MNPTTLPFYNLIYLGVLAFAVFFFVLGLMAAISVLQGKSTFNKTITIILGALFLAAFIVMGTFDLLSGPANSLIIKWVNVVITSVLNTTINPWPITP